MDIRQLRYFVAIAEEGSLSAASQLVNVAQPSLSQHIIALEKELDVELLVRSHRGVTLTECGNVLLLHARQVIAALEEAKEAVRQSDHEPQGEVSFGLPSSIAAVLSVPLAETVRVELPKVKLRVIDVMSGFIKEWLENQTIDLGVLYDLDTVRHLDHRELMTEELHFFSAPDAWPFARSPDEPVSLADLSQLELVLPSPHHGLRSMVDRISKGSGVKLRVTAEMDGLAQIKTMVARGSCYTILAPAAAIDFVERGELTMSRIIDPTMVRPVYLMRNAAKPVTRASREVERLTLEVIRDLIDRRIWKRRDS